MEKMNNTIDIEQLKKLITEHLTIKCEHDCEEVHTPIRTEYYPIVRVKLLWDDQVFSETKHYHGRR